MIKTKYCIVILLHVDVATTLGVDSRYIILNNYLEIITLTYEELFCMQIDTENIGNAIIREYNSFISVHIDEDVKENQLFVLDRLANKDKYIAIDFNERLYIIDSEQIKKNPSKYANIKISKDNKLYLINKLNTCKKFIENKYHMQRFNEKALMIDVMPLQYNMDIEGDVTIQGPLTPKYESIENVIIPDCAETICREAFKYLNIKNVVLGKNLKIIMDDAFKYCTELRNVQFNTNLLKIGNGAFEECYRLHEIEIKGKLVVIGNKAFNNCNLNIIDIEDTDIKVLQYSIFESSIPKILKLPKNLKEIDLSNINITGAEKIVLPITRNTLQYNGDDTAKSIFREMLRFRKRTLDKFDLDHMVKFI